ncbi:MAG: hypothetical protein JRH11_04475 [Deltaproteobacteria bacterium]|nr:hypothetical protein [Deltaproteobacteria bacterium]
MIIIVATGGLVIAGANPVVAQAPAASQGATTSASAEAPEAAQPGPDAHAAPAPLVAEEDTVNLSPGRGSLIAGVVMLSVGTTGLIVAGLFSAMANMWGTANPDYSGANIALAISIPTAVAGIVLLIVGASLNEHARDDAENRAVLLPMVTTSADGEGLVLGAVGTF